jgi:hypothetical protein
MYFSCIEHIYHYLVSSDGVSNAIATLYTLVSDFNRVRGYSTSWISYTNTAPPSSGQTSNWVHKHERAVLLSYIVALTRKYLSGCPRARKNKHENLICSGIKMPLGDRLIQGQ